MAIGDKLRQKFRASSYKMPVLAALKQRAKGASNAAFGEGKGPVAKFMEGKGPVRDVLKGSGFGTGAMTPPPMGGRGAQPRPYSGANFAPATPPTAAKKRSGL